MDSEVVRGPFRMWQLVAMGMVLLVACSRGGDWGSLDFASDTDGGDNGDVFVPSFTLLLSGGPEAVVSECVLFVVAVDPAGDVPTSDSVLNAMLQGAGALYLDPGCAVEVSQFILPAANSTKTLYFKSDTLGQTTLQISGPQGFMDANLVVWVVPRRPSTVRLSGPSEVLINTCSNAFVITTLDDGQVVPTPELLSVTLSASEGQLFLDAGCTTVANDEVDVLGGQSTASFYFKASSAMSVTIAASVMGGGDSRQLTVRLPGLCASAASDGDPFAGGTGTTFDPYQICTAVQFNRVRNNLTASYSLEGDIDLADLAGAYTPIGSTGSPFRGIFNGNSHVIAGFTYGTPSSSNVGLFGYIEGTPSTPAILRNLIVRDCAVVGEDRVGCMAGRVNEFLGENLAVENGSVVYLGWGAGLMFGDLGGTLDGCQTSGTVMPSATAAYHQGAGGVVGHFNSYVAHASILDCVSTAHVEGRGDVGGIVGNTSGQSVSLIERTSFGGTVVRAGADTGYDHAGGIVGHAVRSLIRDVEVTGTVTGTTPVGGIVGRLSSSVIIDSTSSATVSGQSHVGGLVGLLENSSAVVASTFSGTASTSGASARITGGGVGRLLGTAVAVHSSGAVSTSGSNAGGLVGELAAASATLVDSFATGSVAASNTFAGGAVGLGTLGFIKNVYGSGVVVVGVSGAGGLVSQGGATMTGGYWSIPGTGRADSAGGVGLTGLQMQDEQSCVDWDFTGMWTMPAAAAEPSLRWFVDESPRCTFHAQVARVVSRGSFQPNGAGGWTLTSNSKMGRLVDGPVLTYVRYRLAQSIPVGAEVISAGIEFHGNSASSWSGVDDALQGAFALSSNATTPSNSTSHPAGGTVTATPPVRIPASGGFGWQIGVTVSFPGLGTALQSLVDTNAPLAANNHMNLYLWGADSATGEVTAHSWEGHDPHMAIAWKECP